MEPVGHAVPRGRPRTDAVGRALALRVLGPHRAGRRLRHPSRVDATVPAAGSRRVGAPGVLARVDGRQRDVPTVHLARAPAPRSAPHARPGGPCRRGVADRRVERSGQVDGDDARAPLGARRSHGRGQGRTAPALGPGRAEPADGETAIVADGDRSSRGGRAAACAGRGHAETDRLDVRRASSRMGPRARPVGPRGRRDPCPRRRPQRSLVRPRRCGRSSVPAAHDAPVTVRRSGVRPRPHRSPVRLPVPDRDLRAESQARVRLFRAADPARRTADRADGREVRPRDRRVPCQRGLCAGGRAGGVPARPCDGRSRSWRTGGVPPRSASLARCRRSGVRN